MDEPTIDERLKALAESVELLTRDVHEMQREAKRLDGIQRQALGAAVSGMVEYLRIMRGAVEGGGEQQEG